MCIQLGLCNKSTSFVLLFAKEYFLNSSSSQSTVLIRLVRIFVNIAERKFCKASSNSWQTRYDYAVLIVFGKTYINTPSTQNKNTNQIQVQNSTKYLTFVADFIFLLPRKPITVVIVFTPAVSMPYYQHS